MTFILEIFFFVSVFAIGYNYVLYPVAINLYCQFRRDPHLDKIDLSENLPKVTFVVAAFNEEKVITQKIENTFELDYPAEKLQIIIVSDGSDDDTASIAKGYTDKGVLAMHIPERQGKSAALNRALEKAEGDIILFSDANNDFNKQAVRELVKHFGDPEIGAVTGAKHIYASDEKEAAKGDGLYWKYEAFIKKAESEIGSITAAEGEILAVKKSLMNPIDPTKINDDAAITFDIVKSGYRMLYEPNARAEEHASSDLLDDITVKIRMTAGGFQTIAIESDYLFPPRTWFAFSFFSHKILRWVTPHMMMIAFLSNALLFELPVFKLLFVLQLVFYGTALYGWLNRGKQDLPTAVYVPMYFTAMNVALFKGFLRYINGSQKVTWDKAKR